MRKLAIIRVCHICGELLLLFELSEPKKCEFFMLAAGRLRESQFVPISRLSSICAFLKLEEVPEANNWPFVIKENSQQLLERRTF